MKTYKLFILALLVFLIFFSGCIVNIIGDTTVKPILVPEPSIFKLIAGAVLALYEVVVRVIPSAGDYSIVSWLIKAVKKVSDTLNISK